MTALYDRLKAESGSQSAPYHIERTLYLYHPSLDLSLLPVVWNAAFNFHRYRTLNPSPLPARYRNSRTSMSMISLYFRKLST